MIWRDSLKIGVEEIDNQHFELFKRVNSFIRAVHKSDTISIEKVRETLEFMEEYVIKHFKYEEEFLKELEYREYCEHKKIHENFKKEILLLKKEIDNLDKIFIKKFTGKLIVWMVSHIAKEDQKIKKFIKKNNELKKIILKENGYKKSYFYIVPEIMKTILGTKFLFQNECEINEEKGICVKIKMKYDIEGEINYFFPEKSIFSLVYQMCGIEFYEIDEFVESAIYELVNNITAYAATEMHEAGLKLDIGTPEKSEVCIKFGGKFVSQNSEFYINADYLNKNR